ncbi:hypothetical protein OAF75_01690 [Verrucomicrobiales bacterium]|nr:hypothetical protein [Verrucomicrobiales bacterium]
MKSRRMTPRGGVIRLFGVKEYTIRMIAELQAIVAMILIRSRMPKNDSIPENCRNIKPITNFNGIIHEALAHILIINSLGILKSKRNCHAIHNAKEQPKTYEAKSTNCLI